MNRSKAILPPLSSYAESKISSLAAPVKLVPQGESDEPAAVWPGRRKTERARCAEVSRIKADKLAKMAAGMTLVSDNVTINSFYSSYYNYFNNYKYILISILQ
ncbi:MAG: hypothetical protein LBP22_02755 [Deltaproteobacteria bacterium]|nr:hypothetical protein [Deltaproteobacteria bacterium]